ncbi:hypothetical protein [Frondihabitans australicus]|uniref:Uncharacterized protein n=1 Tax=Frondihabitans australicus TaxID=386892 RepID=A0A495IHX7_9MICO|nr:hypothetical protein [Frondihabitans australicus]RKR75583.1 hypothetical protein C8E83_2731 [Frondihabitans australicus]
MPTFRMLAAGAAALAAVTLSVGPLATAAHAAPSTQGLVSSIQLVTQDSGNRWLGANSDFTWTVYPTKAAAEAGAAR